MSQANERHFVAMARVVLRRLLKTVHSLVHIYQFTQIHRQTQATEHATCVAIARPHLRDARDEALGLYTWTHHNRVTAVM